MPNYGLNKMKSLSKTELSNKIKQEKLIVETTNGSSRNHNKVYFVKYTKSINNQSKTEVIGTPTTGGVYKGQYIMIFNGSYGNIQNVSYDSKIAARRDIQQRISNINSDILRVQSIKWVGMFPDSNYPKRIVIDPMLKKMKSKRYKLISALESPNIKGIPKPKSKNWKKK